MKFFKQSILVLFGLVFTGAANAYGLVLGPEAPATSVSEPSILSLSFLTLVVAGVIAVGLSCLKSRQ